MTRILVVDDIATDRLMAGGLLEKSDDWSVDYAVHGQQALEQVEAEAPDLIVTDLMMPEMNGLELVEAICERHSHIPVILTTSQGSEEIAVEALQKGAASYVPKRILARDLVPTVTRVLEASREEHSHVELLSRIRRRESAVLENDFSLISPLIRHLRQTVVAFGVCSQMESLRVSNALDEALLNSLYHGNLEVDSQLRERGDQLYYELAHKRCQESPYCERRVFVTSDLSSQEAVFVIRDEGPGFDPSTLPDPTDPENLFRPHGRGVMLMQTFMDEVRFNDQGNEVTLVKHHDSTTGSVVESSGQVEELSHR